MPSRSPVHGLMKLSSSSAVGAGSEGSAAFAVVAAVVVAGGLTFAGAAVVAGGAPPHVTQQKVNAIAAEPTVLRGMLTSAPATRSTPRRSSHSPGARCLRPATA